MARLIMMIVVLSLTSLALVVYVQLDMPVARVTVSGQLDDAERLQITDAVRQTVKGGLLSADLAEVRSGILNLSWPRAVTIRRIWPDGLVIDVEKPMVVARWQDAYLASDGAIVRLPGEKQDLPVFDCRISEPKLAMEVFHRLSDAATAHDLQIIGLNENELGEWSLSLSAAGQVFGNRASLVVALGADSLAERLARFLIVYEQHLAARRDEIARVDARYDNGVAVSWLASAEGAGLVAAATTTDSASGLKADQL